MSACYSSKACEDLVTSPKHGTVGWTKDNVHMTYIMSEILGLNGWVVTEDYIRMKAARKEERRQLYRLNPHLLQQRIREKQRPQRLLRRASS